MKAATFAARNLIICGVISIHAAREGGDWRGFIVSVAGHAISIHAAREGGDLLAVVFFVKP